MKRRTVTGRNVCKVILLGADYVGKSTLLRRLLTGVFQPRLPRSYGAAFATKTLQSDKGTTLLHIWDTMGEERFRSIVRLYYRDAKAAIICCDVTDSKSFHEAEYWIKELEAYEKCQVYICGTKMDLVQCGSHALQVSVKDLKMFKGDCFLTSSKTGKNVTELFQRIADDFTAGCPGMFDSRPTIELSEGSGPADDSTRRCCGSDAN